MRKKCIKEADESKYEKWVIERKSDNEILGNIDINTIIKNTIIVMLVMQ